MWSAEYSTTTDVPAECLFAVITDINNWPKWDSGLESTELSGPAVSGAAFTLKPKGGPVVRMTVDEARPFVLIDAAHLFLAKLRTTHEYTQSNAQTTIRFRVEMSGPLAFLWWR